MLWHGLAAPNVPRLSLFWRWNYLPKTEWCDEFIYSLMVGSVALWATAWPICFIRIRRMWRFSFTAANGTTLFSGLQQIWNSFLKWANIIIEITARERMSYWRHFGSSHFVDFQMKLHVSLVSCLQIFFNLMSSLNSTKTKNLRHRFTPSVFRSKYNLFFWQIAFLLCSSTELSWYSPSGIIIQ